MKIPESLPDDIGQLKALILQMQEAASEQEKKFNTLAAQYQALLEKFQLAQNNRFGRKSESHPVSPEFFDEAETTGALEGDNTSAASDDNAKDKSCESGSSEKQNTRKPLPDTLPRDQVVHDIGDDEKQCHGCGNTLHQIGQEKTEKLEFIPARIKVTEHIRPKYACVCCEKEHLGSPIKIAKLPPFPIPKSIATPSLLAQIITYKYYYALPLYRQERLFAQAGIPLSRQTLSQWVLKSAALLTPIYQRLHDMLRQESILHADETTVNVIKADRAKCYMWVYATAHHCLEDQLRPNIVLYDYQASRERQHITHFLGDFNGYLQVDGYAAYENTGTTLAGCWAHARRKFSDAKTVQPKGKVGKPDWALNHIQKLYRIEKAIKDKSAQERYAIRQAESRPLLEEFKQWLAKSNHLPPRSKLGEAINYTLNQWPKLITYLEDGRLNIDNNRAERAVKPFVIGRKNWLFSNTGNGAEASAMLYSLVETASANGLVASEYLTKVLTELPALSSTDNIDHLLPWNIETP